MTDKIGAQEALSLKALAGLMIPYGLFLAAVYLIAYWSPFGLMPFQYANVADLGAATLAGLATAFIGLAVGVVVGFLAGTRLPQPSEKYAKWIAGIIFVVSLLGIPLVWIFWDSPAKWYVIGMFATFLVTPLIIAAPIFGRLTSYPMVRVLVVLAICYMPAFMYGRGTGHAAVIRSTDKGFQIDTSQSDVNRSSTQQLKYAGMLGDFHIGYEPATQRTLLIPGSARMTIAPVKALVPAKPRDSSQKD